MTISAQADVEVSKMITLVDAIKQGMGEGLQLAGDHIVDLASQLAPVDEGDLSKSGKAVVVENVLDVSFGNDLPDDRAIAQEYGTIYMPAQPYLSVAVKEIDIVEDIAQAIRRRLV